MQSQQLPDTLKECYQPEKAGYFFNDCYFLDKENILQIGILGFCGCGRPEENISFIKEALVLIKEIRGLSYDEGKPLRDAFFKDRRQESFFRYWADRGGFLEHGGSVNSGWVSEKGEHLLRLIEEYEKDKDSPTLD